MQITHDMATTMLKTLHPDQDAFTDDDIDSMRETLDKTFSGKIDRGPAVDVRLDLEQLFVGRSVMRYSGDHLQPPEFEQEPTIADEIVFLAARQLLGSLERDARGDLLRRVKDIRDEVIREQIEPLVREAIEKPIQKTDGFGNVLGEPTTLAELIQKQVTEALHLPPKGSGTRTASLLNQVIAENVNRELTTELKGVVNEAKAKVIEAVQAKGAEFLAQATAALSRT